MVQMSAVVVTAYLLPSLRFANIGLRTIVMAAASLGFASIIAVPMLLAFDPFIPFDPSSFMVM